MSYLSTTCPYCGTANTSFKSVAEHKSTHTPEFVTVFFYCNHCDNGISVLFHKIVSDSPHDYKGDVSHKNSYWGIINIQPKDTSNDIPEYLPGNIASYYRQAADNLRRHNWDACGIMCRKVLDVTASKDSAKFKLKDKIDDLAEKHLITPQLQEWSHSMRLDGNEAAHESEPYTEDEARMLFKFTDIFVLYMHTMPGMLEARKNGK